MPATSHPLNLQCGKLWGQASELFYLHLTSLASSVLLIALNAPAGSCLSSYTQTSSQHQLCRSIHQAHFALEPLHLLFFPECSPFECSFLTPSPLTGVCHCVTFSKRPSRISPSLGVPSQLCCSLMFLSPQDLLYIILAYLLVVFICPQGKYFSLSDASL